MFGGSASLRDGRFRTVFGLVDPKKARPKPLTEACRAIRPQREPEIHIRFEDWQYQRGILPGSSHSGSLSFCLVIVDDSPGTGVDWNDKAVSRYSV